MRQVLCKECDKELPLLAGLPAGLPRMGKKAVSDDLEEAIIVKACRKLRLCRYCYEARFPVPPEPLAVDELMAIVNMAYDNTDDDDEESPYGWLDQFFGKDR